MEAHPVQFSLLPTFLFLPPPYFFPLFLPHPNFVWAISPSSLFCSSPFSYQPDPGAFAINAFHLSWDSLNFYAFPPFCIIQKMLQKIRKDSATGVILIPYWPTQAWWPVLTQETEHFSVTIRPSANPPTEQNNQTATLPFVRGLLQSQGLSETASTIIL